MRPIVIKSFRSTLLGHLKQKNVAFKHAQCFGCKILREEEVATQLLLIRGAAAKFKQMSGLPGMKNTSLFEKRQDMG